MLTVVNRKALERVRPAFCPEKLSMDNLIMKQCMVEDRCTLANAKLHHCGNLPARYQIVQSHKIIEFNRVGCFVLRVDRLENWT